MEVGEVKTPESKDFEYFNKIAEDDEGWTLNMKNTKKQLFIYTKQTPGTKIQMIKIKALFPGISAALLYDVLHDTEYTKQWDVYCVETRDLCYIDPMNDISYYAMKLQPPLRNRDFVLQRSWLYDGKQYVIFNHSVNHKECPPKKDFIRAISVLTGFLIKPIPEQEAACHLTYISQSDPKGSIPSWFVNSVARNFAPKQIKTLQKACRKYDKWKNKQKNPNFKPWLDPEQLMTSLNKIVMADVEVEMPSHHASAENLQDGEFVDEKALNKVLNSMKTQGDHSNSNSDDEQSSGSNQD